MINQITTPIIQGNQNVVMLSANSMAQEKINLNTHITHLFHYNCQLLHSIWILHISDAMFCSDVGIQQLPRCLLFCAMHE